MAAIEQIRAAGTATSEDAARRTLRGQIARLERELSAVVVATYPRLDRGPRLPSLGGPRLLSLGELERMLADPPAHKWRRLSNADLGRPGCTTYHVRPRAGLLGMLMGWWQVKISGGCP